MENRKLEITYKFDHKPTQQERNAVYKCYDLFNYDIHVHITYPNGEKVDEQVDEECEECNNMKIRMKKMTKIMNAMMSMLQSINQE